MRKFLVFLLVTGLVFCISAPISAQEQTLEARLKALEETIGCWVFYGSARYTTFYNDKNLSADSDDAGTTWALQGNSRIGARVNKDKITGRFEYGTGVNLRVLYGAYDFGDGTFLIGQDYTPLGS
ncbi:MAG: hypothetical protein RRA35_08675, partial [Desulfomonilia bacterium]|nr:hypothetical protein [Desulfomonilia bacterium]